MTVLESWELPDLKMASGPQNLDRKQTIYIWTSILGKKKVFFWPFGTPGFAFKLGLLTRKKDKIGFWALS